MSPTRNPISLSKVAPIRFGGLIERSCKARVHNNKILPPLSRVCHQIQGPSPQYMYPIHIQGPSPQYMYPIHINVDR